MPFTILNPYKQRCNDHTLDDTHALMTSVVPSKLESSSMTIWENHCPSSSKLCRPLRLQFRQETAAATLEENDRMQAAISRLTDFQCTISGKLISVHYQLFLTMIDGKVSHRIVYQMKI